MEKNIITILGVVFLVVGVLGFFNDPLLGVFDVDTVHNIIHLLSGALALVVVGMGAEALRMYAKIFGAVYGVVGAVGFLTSGDMILGLFMSNTAGDVLHLALAVVLLYVGFGRPSHRDPIVTSM
ncbi:MAG: DUF4383 domain-containing protein [Candidatus Moranbacteria bacterium]|nr:DUF4383 domain-containing protein [Candidatus Moranbacteria bacterium]